MRLRVVGTGSSGNTYLLTDENGKTLVLDCGVRFAWTKIALNFQIKGIVGALVTHQHKDHSGYSHEYEAAGIRVFRPYSEKILRQDTRFGSFKVKSFDVVHNVPCVGYLIEHPEIGRMLYVTDTEYVKYKFSRISTMLIEANYDNRYVNKDQVKFQHVITGHMSLQTTMDFVQANAGPELNSVILCHLSANNADPIEFKKLVTEIVPPGCDVAVAEAGMGIDIWR